MPHIYNIESHLPFAENFAAGLMRRYGEDLPDVHIYLPTVRSIKSLSDAFLKLTDGKPVLLPCMYSLADVPQEEMDFAPDNIVSGEDILTPPLPLMRRLFLLARLVRRFTAAESTLSAANVLALARSLGHFLDMMQISEVSLEKLDNLCPDDYAAHWQKILSFLSLLKTHWPNILREQKAADIMAHQNEKLNRLGEFLKAQGASDTRKAVIVAGTTGSRTAVRRFACAVAALPHGAVVLPGADIFCHADEWSACGEDYCHPQYNLHHFLHALKTERKDLKPWHAEGDAPNIERVRFLSWVMRSGEAYKRYPDLPQYEGDLNEALRNVRRYDCQNENEEARLIAYHMRHVLETPEKTAALVTPSRRLSVKVATELKRWDVHVAVSAGQLLNLSPVGQYLNLVADTCESLLRPIKLLGLLQHPLTACGMAEDKCARLTAHLERQILRGAKPDKSFPGLRKRLTERRMAERAPISQKLDEELQDFIDDLENRLSPLMLLQNKRTVKLAEILSAHISAAENLAATRISDGASRLWKGEDGIRLAEILAEALPHANFMEAIKPSDYPAFFDELIGGESFSQPYSHHPRLFIWGTLEARLQSADVMILGGLDEEVWPQALPADAWMSPAMRERCGLPAAEQRIGLSAHDFWQATASGAQVIFTRAQKREGAPMAPSRWLERIEAALIQRGQKDLFDENKDNDTKLHWHKLLNGDKPLSEVFPRPQFAPPAEVRPQRLSVTRFKLWRQDPYALYAERILHLHPLDAIEQPQEAAIKGKLIHTILERAIKDTPHNLTHDKFDKIAIRELQSVILPQIDKRFMHHKLKSIGKWFVDGHAGESEIMTECRGEMPVKTAAGDWLITALADRIDINENGECDIIDYKSGSVSTKKSVMQALDPQLSLEAWMANEGAFGKALQVKSLQLWRVAGQFQPMADDGLQGGEIAVYIGDAELAQAIENAKRLAHDLIEIFADGEVAYVAFPDPAMPPSERINPYAYFERLAEWSGAGGGHV